MSFGNLITYFANEAMKMRAIQYYVVWTMVTWQILLFHH